MVRLELEGQNNMRGIPVYEMGIEVTVCQSRRRVFWCGLLYGVRWCVSGWIG